MKPTLLHGSTMSSAPNFCFLCISLQSKRKISNRRKTNSKNKMFICEISSTIILICRKLESVGPVQPKIKLSSPY